MRGEDVGSSERRYAAMETPPRAWGRRYGLTPRGCTYGNTPTCVGKTTCHGRWRTTWWKHPHVRGEDQTDKTIPLLKSETPPRAWGRPGSLHRTSTASRNTPTCVGKTFRCRDQPKTLEKHPHVRGEDTADAAWEQAGAETPPRAWGRQNGS